MPSQHLSPRQQHMLIEAEKVPVRCLPDSAVLAELAFKDHSKHSACEEF